MTIPLLYLMVRLLPYAVILSTLLCCAALSAQQQDTRLSIELPEPVLPVDARIQSVATIGGRTLVVWGSTADQGGGEIRNVLYMQFVELGAPAGSPVLLIGPNAAPSGFLQIDTANCSFFIFWNDRRSGSQQGYVVRVDTAGTVGTEHLLEASGFAPAGPFVYGTTSGVLLLWNNILPNAPIMAIDCDSLGTPLGSPRSIATGPLSGLDRLTGNPRRGVIDRGTLAPVLLDEHGRSITLGMPGAVLGGPYHVTLDGTVVTIKDSILSYYHSLLDSLPYKRITVGLPAYRFPGSEFVAADSSGRMVIGYCGFHVAEITGSTYYYLSVWLRPEISDSLFGPPVEHRVGFWRDFHHCYDYDYKILGVNRIRRCKTRYEVEVRLHVSAIWDCISLPGNSYSRDDTVKIAAAGAYTGAVAVPCPAQAPAMVRRLIDGYRSSVEVSLREGPVRLSAPVATQLQNIPQLYPAFVVSNGSLGLAWLSGGQRVVAPLVAWDVASGRTQGPITELPIDSIVPGVDLSRIQSRPIISTSGNRFLLTTKRTWRAADDSGRGVDSSEFRFYMPAGMEWRLVRTITVAGGIDRLRPLRFASVPDQPYDLIGYQWVAANGTRGRVAVDAVDADGAIVWSIDTLVASAADPYLVQVGPRELLLLQGGYYQYFDGDSLYPALSLPGMSNPYYAPMLGSRFLRWSAYHSIAFALHDRDGKVSHPTRNIGLPYDSPEFTLVQNPVDSGFAFLYGGRGGVHMIVVDKSMNVVAQNLVISETRDSVGHPVAVYVADTLYVAWEDYRNGVADIYGRAIPFDMRAGVPRSADIYRSEPFGAIASIEPNPAGGPFTVRLREALPPGAIMDIIDVHGAIVASQSIAYGSNPVTVNAGTLPAGNYLVVVRADILRGCAHLVVVR